MFLSSQFYVTFQETPHLDKKHTVFGKLVGGEDILDALEALPVKPGTERPAKPVRITEIIMYVRYSSDLLLLNCCLVFLSYQDPFEEYKSRQQKKLARKAEAEETARTRKATETRNSDNINWFGVKVGLETGNLGRGVVDGVGKYLNFNAKRPAPDDSNRSELNIGLAEDSKKKRKIGFGNFEGW